MGKTVSKNRETPCLSTGSRLTAKNSPDFLKAEIISLDPKFQEEIKKEALSLTGSGVVLIAPAGICFLIFAIAVTVMYFTGIRDEKQIFTHITTILCSWGVSIAAAIFCFSSYKFKEAINNGSINAYRFKVVNKEILSGREGRRSNHIYFGGVTACVNDTEYKDIASGDYVYCAVIEHSGKRYFCYLGKKYILA